ncbi:MAG: Rrf2 family transcriptional regulator [Dehalococcoidia bacterium]|nr:Rrf2 family transcriptional regulator [Dehalococcoidia bacterium]
MKLSTRGDYAVRALLELTFVPAGELLPLSAVADRTSIPFNYLEQIFKDLRTGRLVRSQRGQRGGYQLARPASEITIGEVIRVMEGPLAPTLCASRTQHQPCATYLCPNEDECVLREMWLGVRDAISGILDHTTFADLAERQRHARSNSAPRYSI